MTEDAASPIKQRHGNLTYILAVIGDYGRVESDLARSIERMEEAVRGSECRIIAALEDSRWKTVPLLQTLAMRLPEERLTVICGDCADRPARLFSKAVDHAESDFVQFLWPGCLPQLEAVAAACRDLEVEDLDWLAFAGALAEQLPELCSPDFGNRFYSYYLACGNLIPLCQAVVRRRSFQEMQGFSDAPLLQREFDADFWLRSVLRGQKGAIRAGTLAQMRWDWASFPLRSDYRVPRYLSHSYRVRKAAWPRAANPAEGFEDFAADLPRTLRRTVARLMGDSPSTVPHFNEGAAYKIAVTGGPNEHAHNRLCFYNHFAQLEGRGLFTYVPLLDSLIVPERDLRGVDAVIISRGRHANLRAVLDHCRRHSIATLAMIDDNWFSVGKDWPEYAPLFSPGLPQYEMFLSCLRECDAVLLYNDVLADDVRGYARRIIRLPVNVRQSDFEAPMKHPSLKGKIESVLEWRRQTGGLVVGYAGSLRYSDAAFQALAAVSQRQSPAIKTLLFGRISARQQEHFGGQSLVLPYVGYDDYAAAMGALKPDILLAPLDRSRTSMSKCPNKYLEYSIAGAAGVFTDTSPYTQTIIDGKTGLLVRDDDEASWSAAIGRLVADPALRQSIAAAARCDVRKRFETGVVAPLFAQALLDVIREHRLGMLQSGRPVFADQSPGTSTSGREDAGC